MVWPSINCGLNGWHIPLRNGEFPWRLCCAKWDYLIMNTRAMHCRCNTSSLQNRHTITRGIGCLLWLKTLNYVLSKSPQCCMLHVFDCVITPILPHLLIYTIFPVLSDNDTKPQIITVVLQGYLHKWHGNTTVNQVRQLQKTTSVPYDSTIDTNLKMKTSTFY